ncbi:MAG: alpha-L-fucosidase [Eubacteriales bacterium]|nr:alpha-L-fucosidase [Eubacteriales bacterium]
MRPIRRAIHIDFHTMPGIHDFGSRWDPEKFAAMLKKAGVEYINAFAKCNLGFAYYPTEIGIPYPGLKGDMLKETIEECHRRDIGVSAYVNVGLDHEQARLHREWCVVNKDGQVIYGDKTANFFRNMCYKSGYHDYITGIIREVMGNYDADGLFCDCMGLRACYGNECLEEIKGAGLDPLDDGEVIRHSREVLMDLCREIKAITGNDRYLILNGIPYRDSKDMNTHIEIECLPSAWGYDNFWPQAAYARTLQKTVLYMTGRFQASWGDFGGYKGRASLENDVWDAQCNGTGISVGDHMHPAGFLEPSVYEDVGEIFSEIKALEPWTDGAAYMADIGILTDSDGGIDAARRGAVRMLGELKHSCDIVNEDMDLSGYKALILPDNLPVTAVLKVKLQKHLDEGKGILSTGEGGLDSGKTGFALEHWKFKYEGTDTSNTSYFRMREEAESGIGDMDQAMYDHGILIKAGEGADILADYVKPYFNRHWDGFHGYFYTPPEKKTEYVAAACAGNVFHICFKIFSAYYNHAMISHKKLVAYCLNRILPRPLIKCAGIPSTARVTLTGRDDMVLLHVKTTHPEVRGKMNIIEEHQVLPAGASVSVQGIYAKVYMAPSGERLEFEPAEEGYTKVVLPEIKGYRMIVLEK